MWKTEVKEELEFNGSSGEFVSQVSGFNNGAQPIDGVSPFSIRRVDSPSEIWFRAEAAKGFGYITVQALPNDHALVRISAADDDDWAALSETWDLLASELEKHGWIQSGRKLEGIAKRHAEVDRLWTAGKTDEEIAEILAVDDRTIRRDRKKLGLRSR